MKIIQSFKNATMKNKILLVLAACLSLWLLFYFRYHIIYPGVSKVKMVSSGGGVSELIIPNEMIFRGQNPPIYGERSFVSLDLEPGVRDGRSPKYTLWIKPNGNNNSLLRLSLPIEISRMDEVESDFKGYKKYAKLKPSGTSVFMLVGKKRYGWPTYIQCMHGQQIPQTFQKLARCTYKGIYNENLTYRLSFPGEELGDIDQLIIYAQNSITNLLDKE